VGKICTNSHILLCFTKGEGMNYTEVLKLMAALKAVYPSLGREEPGAAARAWAVALRDVPYAAASRGAADYIREERYPPTPADLRKCARRYYQPLDGFHLRFLHDAVACGLLTPDEAEQARAAAAGGALLEKENGHGL